MNAFTFLGRVEFFLVLVPFLYWAVDRHIGFRALLILFFTDFITISFKLLLHQPRPYWIGGVKLLGPGEPSYGVPSSHASNTLAVGGYLLLQIKQRWIQILIGIVIFFIGFSRLYLGLHFPHDVLFGWLIGFAVLWAFLKWEKGAIGWLDGKSLSTQILIGFVISILFIAVGVLIRFLVSGTPDPAEWSQYSTESRSLTHFLTLAGATFGTFAGYALTRRYAPFDAKGAWGKRFLRYVVGIFGLLVLYIGLSLIFDSFAADESALGYILRYLRYGTITLWAIFLAPWIFIKTGLADIEK
jgi:hypothetical protein